MSHTQAVPLMELGRQHPSAIEQGAWLLFGGDLTSVLLKECCGEKNGAAPFALVNMACAKAVKAHRDLVALRRATYSNTVKEHLVADLGSLPDDVLIEIVIALQQEAHRRSQDWPAPDLAVASTAGAASVKVTLRHVSDDALLRVVAAVRLEASRREGRYAYSRFRLASAASGLRRMAASDSSRPLQDRLGRFRRKFWSTSRPTEWGQQLNSREQKAIGLERSERRSF